MRSATAMMPASKRREVSPESFPANGEQLNFDLGCTDSQGSHVIVTSKLCHLHPPAGIVSRARILVSEDGTFHFQVLLISKEESKVYGFV